jgi:hypothetical protein
VNDTATKEKPSLQAAQCKALRAFNLRFCNELPNAARAGDYDAVRGDGFADKTLPLPSGAYRVHGSQWVLVVRDGRFTRAITARPENKFGGDDVIEVPPERAPFDPKP